MCPINNYSTFTDPRLTLDANVPPTLGPIFHVQQFFSAASPTLTPLTEIRARFQRTGEDNHRLSPWEQMSPRQPGHRLPEPGDRLKERGDAEGGDHRRPPQPRRRDGGGMEGWGRDGGGMEEALPLPEHSRSQSQRRCVFYNLQQIERVPFSC